MNADAQPLLSIFENKIRLEVPLFQRPYVWSREQQWEPLWEDISRQFIEYLQGRRDGPVHFFGAMVMDQKQTPIKYVPKRQIVDGQQRLTTIQIFLAAFRDFCRLQGCDAIADECDKYTRNTGMMADPMTEQFKVWPTQADRPVFRDVMTLGSLEAIEQKYPLIKKKYSNKYEPRPRMVDAYSFVADHLKTFFVGTPSDQAFQGDRPLCDRLDECLQAFTLSIYVVVIDLDHGDDAQVIFETLNARGEPLLPADLLRNFIFLRAARAGENTDALYTEFWRPFDDDFWRHEVRQGRLLRPRSDLFMQHFLSSRRLADIPVKHLYVEYKYWIEKVQPFKTVPDELRALASQRNVFRRFLESKTGDPLAPLARVLDIFDLGTAYPLLLAFAETAPSDQQWNSLSRIMESFIVRRSVCGWTTQAYNRVFLGAMKQSSTSLTVESIEAYLRAGKGESVEWPSDSAFHERWMNIHAYKLLSNSRIVHILKRISDRMINANSEDVVVHSPLTVEHIMPQSWVDNWLLADGTRGATREERDGLPASDPRREQSDRRDAILQTFGNLTLVTQPLNSILSNGPWLTKRPHLTASLLPLNQPLLAENEWSEVQILERGEMLFRHALQLWARN